LHNGFFRFVTFGDFASYARFHSQGNLAYESFSQSGKPGALILFTSREIRQIIDFQKARKRTY